jgi:hypothetical protein
MLSLTTPLPLISCRCCTCCTCCTAEGNVSNKDGKQHSYFLATDPKLLEIMDQQGLSCATRMVEMSKEDKPGMDSQLLRLVNRGVVKEGSIKGFVGECKAATGAWLIDLNCNSAK